VEAVLAECKALEQPGMTLACEAVAHPPQPTAPPPGTASPPGAATTPAAPSAPAASPPRQEGGNSARR
jgi:hypothetical protein